MATRLQVREARLVVARALPRQRPSAAPRAAAPPAASVAAAAVREAGMTTMATDEKDAPKAKSVSYTHLTLPTIYSV